MVEFWKDQGQLGTFRDAFRGVLLGFGIAVFRATLYGREYFVVGKRVV